MRPEGGVVARQNLLVVDADQRSLSVLEVSLRNAGYNVAACASVERAFEILEANKPDLILSDTQLSDSDGFDFVERLRENPAWSRIPFMFLSSDGSIESKIRGLELGVRDYLTKPIYIREVIARVGIELSRHARDGLALRNPGSKTRFSGSLTEMGVVDLLQTIDVSRKTGVLFLIAHDDKRGAIFFDSGSVIHAHVGDLEGEEAVYRLLLWREGNFDLEFRPVRDDGENTVRLPTPALLMEGMHRIDEWSRLLEQLPSLDAVLDLDAEGLRENLRHTPDEQNALLRLVDGERSVAEILDEHGGDHVAALRRLVDLYFEGSLQEVGRADRSIPVLTGLSALDPNAVHAGPDTIPGPGNLPLPGEYADLPIPPLDPHPEARRDTPVGFQAVSAEVLGGWRYASSVPPGADPEADPPSPARGVDRAPGLLGEELTSEGKDLWADDDTPTFDDVAAADLAAALATPVESLPPVPGAPSDDVRQLFDDTPPPAPPDEVSMLERADLSGEREPVDWPHQAADGDWSAHLEADQRETREVSEWDQTLDELRHDPEVSDAIAKIDSDPPPAPFVRSTPPLDREIDEAISRAEGLASSKPRAQSRTHRDAIVEYRERDRAKSAATGPPAPFTGTGLTMEALRSSRVASPSRRRPFLRPLLALFGASVVLLIALTGSNEDRGPELEEGEVALQTLEPPVVAASATPPEIAQDDRPEPKQPSYQEQLDLARSLKRGSPAVEAYRQAVELNPNGSDALAELALLMLNRQRNMEAARLAKRATEIDPQNSLAWVTLGSARQHMRDGDGARRAYRSCVRKGEGPYVAECRAMLR